MHCHMAAAICALPSQITNSYYSTFTFTFTQLQQALSEFQASAAVVTLTANPRAHQTQSRHPDVQGSSDVITAVPKFAAERSHPVTDAPTFQHAAPDRAENAHWTCQASVLRRCTFSVEQSAGRCCWHKHCTYFQKTLKNLSVSLRLPHLIRPPSACESVEYTALYKFFFDLILTHKNCKSTSYWRHNAQSNKFELKFLHHRKFFLISTKS